MCVIINMRGWKILVVVAYILGYYALINSRYFEEDPMREMNEVAGPLLY